MSAIAAASRFRSTSLGISPTRSPRPNWSAMIRPVGARWSRRPVPFSRTACLPPTIDAAEAMCLPERNSAAFDEPPPTSTLTTDA